MLLQFDADFDVENPLNQITGKRPEVKFHCPVEQVKHAVSKLELKTIVQSSMLLFLSQNAKGLQSPHFSVVRINYFFI